MSLTITEQKKVSRFTQNDPMYSFNKAPPSQKAMKAVWPSQASGSGLTSCSKGMSTAASKGLNCQLKVNKASRMAMWTTFLDQKTSTIAQ